MEQPSLSQPPEADVKQKRDPKSHDCMGWIASNDEKIRPISDAIDAGKRDPFCVYVLDATQWDSSYTGETRRLAIRMAEHNEGKSKATAKRRPFRVAGVISGLSDLRIARELERAVQDKHWNTMRTRFPRLIHDFPSGWSAASQKIWRLKRYVPYAQRLQSKPIHIQTFLDLSDDDMADVDESLFYPRYYDGPTESTTKTQAEKDLEELEARFERDLERMAKSNAKSEKYRNADSSS